MKSIVSAAVVVAASVVAAAQPAAPLKPVHEARGNSLRTEMPGLGTISV